MPTSTKRKKAQKAAPASSQAKRNAFDLPAGLRRPLTFVLKILLVVYVALVGFPVRYHVAGVGLDPSWAVALNLFHVNGIIHGKDVGFTYGPLGYLTLPMPFGSNLAEGIAFQLAFWVIFVAMIAWLAFAKKLPGWRLLIFAICLFPGSRAFYEFGYAGPDFFLEFLALLFLAASAYSSSLLFYGVSVAIAALLLLIKLSTGIAAVAGVLSFPVALFLFDKRRALQAAAMGIVGVPVLFAAAFLIYEPSLASMGRYLRMGMEISSGFSSVMGEAGSPGSVRAALLVLGCYTLLAVVLFWRRDPAFCIAFACAAPLFTEFKHAFVREAGHTEIFFTFFPLVAGLVLLFMRYGGSRWWLATGCVFLTAGAWGVWEKDRVSWAAIRSTYAGLQNAASLPKIIHFQQLNDSLASASAQALRADRLPPELLARIGARSVTIFPWECSYAAANPINYRPLPILQTYAAYTAYLDQQDAAMLDDNALSPDFILLNWSSVDDRHPLLDVPATSVSIYRHYELDGVFGQTLLLRRRSPAFSPYMRLIRSAEVRFGEPLEQQLSPHPLVVKVFLKSNTFGRLREFFSRVPEMRAILSSEGNRYAIARVPPRVLSNGIPLNFLPSNSNDLSQLLSSNTVDEPLNSLVIAGAGSSGYQEPIHMEVWELTGVELKFGPREPEPKLSELTGLGVLDSSRIEALNQTGVVGIPSREVVEISGTAGYLGVTGWVFGSPDQPPPSVFIDLDGKLYRATYGRARGDIASLFRDPKALRTGFDWSMPAWKLGKQAHQLQLKIVLADGRFYYEGAQKVRFKITD